MQNVNVCVHDRKWLHTLVTAQLGLFGTVVTGSTLNTCSGVVCHIPTKSSPRQPRLSLNSGRWLSSGVKSGAVYSQIRQDEHGREEQVELGQRFQTSEEKHLELAQHVHLQRVQRQC